MTNTLITATFLPTIASGLLATTANEPTVMLLACITALAGTVAALWKMIIDDKKATYEKLNDCEKDRESLWKALADVACEQPEDMRKKYKPES